MSTRRARIKPVASLPVRRKNRDTNDNKKTKQNLSIDTLKSSEEAATDISKEQPINDAASVTTGGKSTRRQSRRTPKISEKTASITPTSLYRIVNSPILSPKVKKSPIKRITETLKKPISEETSKRCESVSDTDFITIPIQENVISPQKQSNLQTNNTYTANIGSDRELVSNGREVDGVVDGIVPLQSVRKVRKSLDLLMNEIISENAEVLFDPIVPLPSSSKVHPKLPPVPRLASFRRNSIQGSTSESEDESRCMLLGNSAATPISAGQRHDSHTSLSTPKSLPNRKVSRVRNDSVCSVLSLATTQPTMSASPIKKKRLLSKSKRLERSKRRSAIQRRQQSLEGVPKDSLTMYDLIFNLPTNANVHDKEEENVLIEKKKELKKLKKEELKKLQGDLEDNVDDPPFTEPTEKAAPVPQIKLGPNGEIMLDEKSLVIEQTEGTQKLSTSVIREGEWANSGKGKYTRKPRTADWSDAETVRFYRALAGIGTDFSIMTILFPKRTRRDLKLKFKKEEKINGAQVDKALRAPQAWDGIGLEKRFKQERHEEALNAEKEKQFLKEQRQIELNRIRAARARGLTISKAAMSVEIAPASRHEKLCRELTANEILEQYREGYDSIGWPMSKPAIPAQVKRKTPHKVSITTLKRAQKKLPATVNSIGLGSSEIATATPNDSVTIAPPKYVNPKMPSNIEAGSLVVLKVKDPSCTTKTMLQTYVADPDGRLSHVALSQPILSTVMNYMNKDTPKADTPKASTEPLSSQSGSTNNVTETAVSSTKSTCGD